MQIASGFCHLAEMGHLVLVQVLHPNNHRPMALSDMQRLCFSLVFAFRLCIGCRCLIGLICLSHRSGLDLISDKLIFLSHAFSTCDGNW